MLKQGGPGMPQTVPQCPMPDVKVMQDLTSSVSWDMHPRLFISNMVWQHGTDDSHSTLGITTMRAPYATFQYRLKLSSLSS